MPIIASELFEVFGHLMGTALETGRKVWATVRLYGPNPLGYTRATMARTMGCYAERRR